MCVCVYLSQKVPSTVDGMLGGYGSLSAVDVAGSTKFISKLTSVSIISGKEEGLVCYRRKGGAPHTSRVVFRGLPFLFR